MAMSNYQRVLYLLPRIDFFLGGRPRHLRLAKDAKVLSVGRIVATTQLKMAHFRRVTFSNLIGQVAHGPSSVRILPGGNWKGSIVFFFGRLR